MRFLTKRLEHLKVVYPSTQQEGKVFFGAWVELEDEDGELVVYRLVGPDEFNIRENKLSIDSPMARGLLGKSIDDEVNIYTPSGDKWFTICRIWYKEVSE